jgi:hypothetical protein
VPKKLKERKTKFNDPRIEEAEKRILAVTMAAKRGEFEPQRERDVLTEALGNPKHHGHVCGLGSRKRWKTMPSSQADANAYHSRQMYKEGLIQKGREQAMQEMINKSIMDAFTSMDPQIVELRRKMFRQDGVLPQEGPSGVQQGQLVLAPGNGQLQRYPVDDIVKRTMCTLEMPFDRARRKKSVAQAMALPPDSSALYDGRPIPAEYARVEVAWTNTNFDQEEIDIPTDDGGRLLGSTLGSVVLWNKADIVLEMPTLST